MEQHPLHDLDLIAAYSEGLLADPGEAARLVGECADCRKEYDLQQTVKGLLADLPIARMTAAERSRLDAAIGSITTARVVAMADRRRVQGWMRAASVAAAAVVLIGLGSVFLGLMDSGSQSATTTAGADGNFASADAGEAAATTTILEESTTVAAATGQGELLAYRQLAGGDADAVQTEIETMLEQSFVEFSDASARADVVCEGKVSDREVLDVAQSKLDGRRVVIVIVEGEDGREALVYNEATCALVELPPE
ncbi:MAG TPA: hypothetical protein VFT54_00155 [Acidimicrobiia bacterium]|nr:hypothetical protein [Acidimicrobiia bacterium]